MQRAVLIGLIIAILAPLAQAADADINIQNPWVRAAPPTVKILAAYMRIENKGNRPRTLTGATSPNFAQVEMHNTILHKGLAKMVREEALEIPPQGSIVFKPGGYHFMLIGPKGVLDPGDMIDMTLMFNNGDRVSAEVVVSKGMEMESSMDHSGHMKHHH